MTSTFPFVVSESIHPTNTKLPNPSTVRHLDQNSPLQCSRKAACNSSDATQPKSQSHVGQRIAVRAQLGSHGPDPTIPQDIQVLGA